MAAQALGLALFFVLTVGTHPITGWMGCCLFAVLAAGGLLAVRGHQLRRRLVILCLTGLAVVVCLSPWLYATALFQRHLAISAGSGQTMLIQAIDGIDRWRVRFFPLPLDLRCLWSDPAEVSTPYLDAQANVPLLVLVGVCLGKWIVAAARRPRALDVGVLVLTLAYLGFCIILSLYGSGPLERLPKPFKMVQFTYRWVNQINLSLLALLCMGLLIRARGDQAAPPIRLGPVFLGCVLTWAGLGVLVKLEHAYFIRQTFYAKLNYRPDAQLPGTFYGLGAYSTPHLFPPLQSQDHVIRGNLTVDPANSYGTVQPLRIMTDQPGVVVTSVEAFPWNKLYVDGRAVPSRDLRRSGVIEPVRGLNTQLHVFQAVPVPAGEHLVEYRFEPNRAWTRLTLLSKLAFATLVLGWAVLFGGQLVAVPLKGRLRRPRPGGVSAGEPGAEKCA